LSTLSFRPQTGCAGERDEPARTPDILTGMDMNEHGFLRVAACAPEVAIADPARNAANIAAEYRALAAQGAAVVLFPELALTGYSCEDLFYSRALHTAARQALATLARATQGESAALVVGCPWLLDDGRLLNCAMVLAGGRLLGAVPKSVHPNYGEFYDKRWFVSGEGLSLVAQDEALGRFPIACEQLFLVAGARFAIEICEDLWAVEPPGARHALAGAEIVLNPSASNELVAKADYRRDLVRMASAQRICGYLYASCGPTESTKDVVFGGHLIAAEDGAVVLERPRFSLGGERLVTEFDVERLRHDRARNATFANARRPDAYDVVDCAIRSMPLGALSRVHSPHPFVPDDEHAIDARAHEILAIQATGLARRALAANARHLVIGLSGGLDSTLAFLVCLDALAALGRHATALHALTMPGPGTTQHTLDSARALAAAGGATLREIPIDAAVAQHLEDLAHPPGRHDVVFENAQARERTQLLFNYANQAGGIVVGTGDLSELALGWCTFNGDHMANYNVNAGVPKTLIAYLVRWYARHRARDALAAVLARVLDTPISPELLPPAEDDSIRQTTETLIGPYELHDFFLYHHLRFGSSPARIYALARASFAGRYDGATLKRWLGVFFSRFYGQQFKRTTLPPGPKVGSLSLSPRGDWRMPDEARADALLAAIARLPD
jgi:NAD+ synthase (glutamine-hydrolysing)